MKNIGTRIYSRTKLKPGDVIYYYGSVDGSGEKFNFGRICSFTHARKEWDEINNCWTGRPTKCIWAYWNNKTDKPKYVNCDTHDVRLLSAAEKVLFGPK